MARNLIPSDKTIRNIKPGDERKRLSDGGGLYLLLFVKGGAHSWRYNYSIDGQRRLLSLGTYPDTGLAAARKKADDYRQLVAQVSIRVGCASPPECNRRPCCKRPSVPMPAYRPAEASRPWPEIG